MMDAVMKMRGLRVGQRTWRLKKPWRCQSLNPYKLTKTTSKTTYTIDESQQEHER
jgi:hypothetical protein